MRLKEHARLLVALAAAVIVCAVYIASSASPMFIQVLINGVFMGGLFGLMAMGLALVFGIMKIINVCHGEFIVLGAYITWSFWELFTVNPFVSSIISFAILFGIGLPIGKFLMNRALRFGVDPPLLVAFGISLIMQGLMRLRWTATPQGVQVTSDVIPLPGGLVLSVLMLLAFSAALTGLTLLHLFLTRTMIGKALRAVSMDRATASLMGINPDQINTLSYGLGLALAGFTGSLIAMIFPFDPTSGGMFVGRSLCVIVLGGVGHILGTFFGGIVLGLSEAVAAFYLGDAVREGVAYIFFLLVLLFKPTGLFAKYKAF
ncbi:MAG: branched-chain amino acid ABC transporter permease [Nitrososphaerota archaeon]|nr:branched-chain amino acid ABC transporter permease [Candidatus Bathyarchaeota archaeon]MDW8024006.1 branched-chain amino acid ABC transporter permease [Nitrososphaerota archaeon]